MVFNIRLAFQWKYLLRTLSKTMDPNNSLIGFWNFQKAEKLFLENFLKKGHAERSNVANKYWFIFLLTVSRTLDPILTKNRMSFFKTFPVLLILPPDVVEQGPDHSRTRSLFTSKVMTGICTVYGTLGITCPTFVYTWIIKETHLLNCKFCTRKKSFDVKAITQRIVFPQYLSNTQ